MATYNRGRHILPSVHSVLGQTLQDFELLVIGDHCTDDTEAALAPLLSDRVRWINLDARGGSQSFPNNKGISVARGRYVAYIGHDDIWAPDHLEAIGSKFAETGAEYVVSGLLFHGTPGVERYRATGLFEESNTALKLFFPPTSLAHRREVTDRVGPWRAPLTIRAPVDFDLQLRAVRAGMMFVSTGKVTAHKFTAVDRYLSYLTVESDEQEAMLKLLESGRAAPFVDVALEKARETGDVRGQVMRDYEALEPGEAYRASAERKGSLVTPPPSLPGEIVLIPQVKGSYAVDWARLPRNGFLWNGSSLRPKFRIPFASDRRVTVTLMLAHAKRTALTRVSVTGSLSSIAVSAPVRTGDHWEAALSFGTTLNDRYGAIFGFALREEQRGIGIGAITVRRDIDDDVRDELKRLKTHLRHMKSSTSWRVTAPLRRLVDGARKLLRKR